MVGPDPHHPTVFISYSHDSLEHSDRVRDLSDRLLADGIDATIDQYQTAPPEGWQLWMERQIDTAQFVLLVCTDTYRRRVKKEEAPGKGLGVLWEASLIYSHLYDAGVVNEKFVPIVFESSDTEFIPRPLKPTTYYYVSSDDGYENLYRRLTDQPSHPKPALGDLRKLRPVSGEVRKLQPLEPKERKLDFFAAQLTNLPFERNPFFTGREEILRKLHNAFTKNSPTSMTQAISGLGGLGKTQTAIEYAYRHRDDYQAVFWVRADSELGLSTGFVEIARVLNLPEKDAQNPDDTVRAVNLWLENNSGWLLIFDNADAPELLKGFRPRNAKGHVLLTSRAQVFDTLGIARPLEIDVMAPEEALQFLFTRTGRDDNSAAERKAAEQIAEELGYLPLALEQAGAFGTAKQARFQDYLAGYRKRRLELLKESGPVTGDYPESVATTWAINFREVENVSEAASDLLRGSAFLSPDRIPLELIIKAKSELGPALSAALADVDVDPLTLNRVLEPLTRYSFIRLDSDSQTYSIHRLVQEVLRDGIDADTQRLWAERTVGALNRAFPNSEFSNWPLCERSLPHAKAAAKLIKKWNITTQGAARLLNEVANYCYDLGQYADAELLYKRSLAIYEQTLEPDHSELAVSLNNLAFFYHGQGKYSKAEPLYERSLTIYEKTLGPDHSDVALSLNNLAVLYKVQGKYTEAEPLFKRSLTIREKALGPDHPDVAQSLNNLAELNRVQDKYTEAEPMYKRSLAISEIALGPDHPDVARTLNNLAVLYQDQGKYTEAEPFLNRSLTIKEKALGSDHPELAQNLNNLAELCRLQGKYPEAEPLYKRALAMVEKAWGPDHPHVALVLANYALFLRATQRDVEAAQMEARAEAIRAKHAQPDAPE